MLSCSGSSSGFDRLGGNFNNVMNFIRGWALATNGADGIGHYFRAMTIISPKMVSGMLPALSGRNLPNGVGTDARKRPDNGGDAAAQPGPSGLLAPKTSLDGGVTGLTAPQESGALGLLLGGGN